MAHLYSTETSHAVEVNVLLFNDAVNVYETATNAHIFSAAIKNLQVENTGSHIVVFDALRKFRIDFGHGDDTALQIVDEIQYQKTGFLSRLIRHRAATLVISMVILVVGLYWILITSIPAIGSKLITTDAEIHIGRKLKELMLRQETAMGATIDSARSLTMNAFAGRLKLSAVYPIHITVVKSKTVNAYALPGGEIVVYTGLLKKMNSYESLVALLGHEVTHVNERHTLRSLLRRASTGLVISVIVGDITGVSGALAANIENLNGLTYSRSLETEADKKGMELMTENKVSPRGMQQLMEILGKETGDSEPVEFLSSHPLSEHRLERAKSFITAHPLAEAGHEELRKLFDQLK